MSAWEWPQYVMALLLALGVVVNISKHGLPRDEHNGPNAFIAAIVIVAILWFGGFWK